MQPDEIQPELRAFVVDRIHSVAQLELLLLLRSDASKPWTAAEAGRSLYISPEMAAGLLGAMQRQNLLVCDASATNFRYGPPDQQVDRRVGELAELYAARRVTVITLIYTEPVDKLQRFADAFRFSRDQNKGN